MRLDYNYFLQRRGLSTEKLIRNNNVESYEDFLKILDNLRVKHISKDDFVEAYKLVNPPVVKIVKKGIKNETATRSPDKSRQQQSKKTNNRSSTARNSGSTKRTTTKQSSDVSKKKQTT